MEYKKNDVVTVHIEDLGNSGEGIGKIEGFTVFVKDAVIGDTVEAKLMKVKKSYAYGKLTRVLVPSEHRTKPRCPVFRQCGGCQIQAMKYEEQLRYKERKIRNSLQRIGGIENPPLEPIIGMEEPFRYRNKAQYPFGTDREGNPTAGFYAGRTHTIIPFTGCYLGAEENEEILEEILSFMREKGIASYDEQSGRGLVRHALIRKGFATKEIMVCLVINGREFPDVEELAEKLREIEGMTSISLNINQERTNVILGKEVVPVWGKPYITDYIGDICYRISPLSFYQVNPVQTKILYETVLEYAGLTGTETVWDLYCGIGTISLFLARRAGKVYGVEIVPEAVEDARRNAEINGIGNVEFYVGKAEETAPRLYEEDGVRADVVVVDPPRKGCDGVLLDTIVKMNPQKVVYVSCDPATLSRDLKYLLEMGFEMVKGRGVDCFPMTGHVETVVLLSKLKSAKSIEVKIELDEMDLTSAESKATYDEIKQYVLDNMGLKVSQLYVAQVKRKHGLIERINYNVGDGKSKVPHVPLEKEKAIEDALRHFKMLS